MRIFWLCLLGLLSWLIATVVLFPAAPVVEKIKPQLGVVALEGVHGKLYKGVVDRVRSTDDLLPLEFSNVAWTLSPKALLSGGAGANVSFDGYGGGGSGQVLGRWNGDMVVSDFDFTVQAKALEPLLPVPIASFAGELSGHFDSIVLANNLLQSMSGSLTWDNAVLERPVPTALGKVDIVIQPKGEQLHVVTLTAVDGDVRMNGSVTMMFNGDFDANILFTPATNASPAIISGLRQMGQADSSGRVRFQRKGNVNRLM